MAYEGIMNHHCPLIRPAMRVLLFGGVGPLDSHEWGWFCRKMSMATRRGELTPSSRKISNAVVGYVEPSMMEACWGKCRAMYSSFMVALNPKNHWDMMRYGYVRAWSPQHKWWTFSYAADFEVRNFGSTYPFFPQRSDATLEHRIGVEACELWLTGV